MSKSSSSLKIIITSVVISAIVLGIFAVVFLLYLVPAFQITNEQIYNVLIKLFPVVIGLILVQIGIVAGKMHDQDFSDKVDKLSPNAYDKPLYNEASDDPMDKGGVDLGAFDRQPVEKIVEKEVIKEVPVEVVKEVIKEVPVEVVKEVTREVPIEIVKEVVKEVPVEVIKEVIKEVPVEKESETVREIEVPVEVIREVPVDVVREVEKVVEKIVEVPVEKIVEVPVEVVKEVVKEVPVEVVKEVIKEVPVEIIKEIPKEVEKVVEKVVEVPAEKPARIEATDQAQPKEQKASGKLLNLCETIDEEIAEAKALGYDLSVVGLKARDGLTAESIEEFFGEDTLSFDEGGDIFIVLPLYNKTEAENTLRRFEPLACVQYKDGDGSKLISQLKKLLSK